MHRVFIGLLMTILTQISVVPDAFANTSAGQDENTWLQQIHVALNAELMHHLNKLAANMELSEYEPRLQISYIDPRLALAPCGETPELDIPMPLKLGRTHIKITCTEPNRWAINVPVDVELFTKVLVFSRPVSRNAVIQADDLSRLRLDLGKLRSGYFIKEENVIGKQSKRALAAKTVITPHLLQPALMVKKGDAVVILASNGQMTVKMGGEALSDGRQGRQIRVKNIRSNRIIKARVTAPGMVQVDF